MTSIVNVVSLIQVLESQMLDNITAEQALVLAQAILKLNTGVVKTVNTYTDLITVNAIIGEVFFVEDESTLYYRGLLAWQLILNPLNDTGAWAWGINSFGQLGDTTTVSKRSPIIVVGGFTDWTSISAGSGYSLGVRANGTAWAWGCNTYGQLGDTTTVSQRSPVSVVGGFTDWTSLSAGGSQGHSLGVRANGTAWAWGYNLNGQLGDGTTVFARSSPVSVVGGFTDWLLLSAAGPGAQGGYSLGVRVNGTAWAWGLNNSGQLGDGTTINKSSPVSVVGGYVDWTSISAGDAHSLGVRANGTAWAWGSNSFGRLGDNTAINKSSPVSVAGGFTDWLQASAGFTHSLGVRSNGEAWAWGSNNRGQLGDTTTVSKRSPITVAGGFSDWLQVSAGDTHSLAVKNK